MKKGKSSKDNKGYQGATFGIVSGVILVLGAMFGLSVIGNKFALILGMIVVGVADAFADAAGMHVSQETESHHSRRGVWLSTIYTLLAKVGIVTVLVLPFLIPSLWKAMIVSGVIGILALGSAGIIVSKLRKRKSCSVLCFEYVTVGILVSALAFGLAELVKYIHSLF